jgi:hypothetical protein
MEESKKYVRTEEINRVKNKLSGNLWYYKTENFVGDTLPSTYTVVKYWDETDKECIWNFGGALCCKIATWKPMKEMGIL